MKGDNDEGKQILASIHHTDRPHVILLSMVLTRGELRECLTRASSVLVAVGSMAAVSCHKCMCHIWVCIVD